MSNNKYKILIADTDIKARKELSELLESNGYKVITAATAAEAVLMFKSYTPDIIISEFFLPDANGIFLIEKIKKESGVPIIILSDNGEEYNKVAALDAGADDYITKPFSPTELLARVDSLYRRVEMHTPKAAAPVDDITLGEFVLNLRRRTLLKNGRNIELTQVEFQMIEYFFNNPDTALDRTDILEKVWGSNYFGEEKIVDVNIRRLRMKVEDDPSQPRHLVTVWGMGYKWNTK